MKHVHTDRENALKWARDQVAHLDKTTIAEAADALVLGEGLFVGDWFENHPGKLRWWAFKEAIMEADQTRSNPSKATQIQSAIFAKDKFTKKEAQDFARRQGWKGAVDEKKNTWRPRQKDPALFQAKSFRTIDIADGVKAVIGRPKARTNPSQRHLPAQKELFAALDTQGIRTFEDLSYGNDDEPSVGHWNDDRGEADWQVWYRAKGARGGVVAGWPTEVLNVFTVKAGDEYLDTDDANEVARFVAAHAPRSNPELPRGSISIHAARLLAGDIGLHLRGHDLEQFRRGLEVEHEHFHTVHGNWNTVAKIVADHLDEDPNYYTHMDIWSAYGHDVDLED